MIIVNTYIVNFFAWYVDDSMKRNISRCSNHCHYEKITYGDIIFITMQIEVCISIVSDCHCAITNIIYDSIRSLNHYTFSVTTISLQSVIP